MRRNVTKLSLYEKYVEYLALLQSNHNAVISDGTEDVQIDFLGDKGGKQTVMVDLCLRHWLHTKGMGMGLADFVPAKFREFLEAGDVVEEEFVVGAVFHRHVFEIAERKERIVYAGQCLDLRAADGLCLNGVLNEQQAIVFGGLLLLLVLAFCH